MSILGRQFDPVEFIEKHRSLRDGLRIIFRGAVVVSSDTAVRLALPLACFMHVLKDFKLLDAGLSEETARRVFARAAPKRRMRFDDFARALLLIAQRRRAEYGTKFRDQELFTRIVQHLLDFDVLVSCYSQYIVRLFHDMSYEIEKVFFEYENVISMIFSKYSEYAEKNWHSSPKVVTLMKYRRFLRDFAIDPDMVCDSRRLFKSFGSGISDDSELLRLSQVPDLLRFCDLLLRTAASLYSNPMRSKDAPPNLSGKLRKLMRRLHTPFIAIFKRGALTSLLVDLTAIKPPNITGVVPRRGAFGKEISVTIVGSEFDRRAGGIRARFGASGEAIPCVFVDRRHVRCTIPPRPKSNSNEVALDTRLLATGTDNLLEYRITATRHRSLLVAASNIAGMYSTSRSSYFTFVEELPKFTVTSVIGKVLYEELFAVYSGRRSASLDPTAELKEDEWRHLTRDMSELTELKFTKQVPCEKVFYRFASKSVRMGGFGLDFRSFVLALVFLSMERLSSHHPANFLERLVLHRSKLPFLKRRQKALRLTNELKVMRAEVCGLLPRRRRRLSVFCGGVLIGRLEEGAGAIVDHRGTVILGRNPFFSYKHLDECSARLVLPHLTLSLGADHAISRLLNLGFDLCAMHNGNGSASATERADGRCWHILTADRSKRIGVLLDVPGRFSCLDFQPREGELRSDVCTLTIYDSTESEYFLRAYKIFNARHANIESVRERIEKAGWKLKTAIYKLDAR